MSDTEECLFHGSPVGGLSELDPARCVIDPGAATGITERGTKVLESVVWLTPDFDVAIAFALKAYVQDLAVDTRTNRLLLEGSGLPEGAHGFVYRVDRTPACREVNPLEWCASTRLVPTECIRVDLTSFGRLRPVWRPTG